MCTVQMLRRTVRVAHQPKKRVCWIHLGKEGYLHIFLHFGNRRSLYCREVKERRWGSLVVAFKAVITVTLKVQAKVRKRFINVSNASKKN